MMQLNVTPDFKKRSLKFKPEFPAAAKLESVELVIPNPDGEIKTAGLSFIIYSARCGGRKLAVCDAFTGTGTITGTLNLCTDRMVDEFYHLPLGTRRSFHAVLWSEADQWMIGAGRIAIANNPGSDSMNPAPLPADRYPTFEEVEEMIRNSGGLDEPVVRRVNGIAPDNAGNVSITIPGDVSELKDKDGLTLTVQQKNTLATLSTTYASKNHTHSEYALKSELPDVSGFITADKLNLYQLKADAFSGKYADLSGKPSAFPPASHTHAVADVNGLADELSRKLTVPAGGNAGQFLMKTVSGCGWSSIDLASYITITQARNEFAAKTHEHSQYALASALQDYAAKVHTHIIGDVTGLQDALDGKAAADHNHDSVYAPKEATAAALNAKLTIPAGGTAGQVIGKTSDGYGWITVSGGVSSWNDLTDKPSAFPPATHNHVIGDVTGLENKLNEKISSVNGQVPNSSGAVTLPVATSKADGLMSAADKEKLDGLDTTGSTGDMLKSVYDTNDDGIVDHAATADAVGATTAAQVADAVGKAHTHANKTTLDKLAETDGKLTFDGAEIGGGSGTVKSVNGQLPDESGNVTIETGGAVDESRLLPETGSVSSDSVGNPVIFKAISRIDNTYWLCLPLNEDTNDRSTYDVATEVYGTVNIVSNAPSSPGGSAFFNGSSCLHGTLPAQFGASDFTVRFWMMAPTISSSSQTIFSTRYGDQTDASTFALLCTTEGRLFIYSNGDITSRTDTPFTLQPSVWYHVAVVRKSGVLTIYVNGEVYNSATFTNSLTRQIFGLGASWTGSSYSEAGTVYLTSLDVLNYAAYDGAFTTPAYQPGILAGAGYEVATDSEFKDMLSAAGIDESRLLPELATIPEELSGHPVVYDYQSGIDADTLCLLHLDDTSWSDATGKNTVTQNGSVAKVSANGYFDNALDLSANLNSGSLSWLTIPWLAEYENSTWTMEFFAKPTKAVVNFMFFSFGNSQGSYLSLGSQSLTNLWLGNGSGTYTGSINMQLNTWYWFVVQYDGTAVKVYVDGTLIVQGNFEPNYIGQDLQFGNLNLVNNQDNTFIGYLDEFRWSKGLRYPTGGMTAPTEPYGTPAKSYKVSKADLVFSDSTRLLPETPDNGAIPCFNSTPPEGVNYNDSHTVMLVQGSTTNMALGTKLPFMVTGTVSAQEDGSLLFPSGSDKLVTTSAAEVKRVFGDEFTVDVYMKPTQFNNTSRQDTNFFYLTGPSTYYIYGSNYNNSGSAVQDRWGVWAYSGQRVITLPNVEYHHAALDVYLVSGSRKYTIYYDGVPVLTGDWYTDGLATAEETTDAVITFFGTSGEASLTNAYVKALRVSDIARYKGVQFTPPAHGTYDNPPAGYWDTVNKSEFKATRVRILSRDPNTRLAVVQPLRLRNGVWETDPDAPEKTVKY